MTTCWLVAFLDPEGVETRFAVNAPDREEATERACVAYAEAYRRSPAEDEARVASVQDADCAR